MFFTFFMAFSFSYCGLFIFTGIQFYVHGIIEPASVGKERRGWKATWSVENPAEWSYCWGSRAMLQLSDGCNQNTTNGTGCELCDIIFKIPPFFSFLFFFCQSLMKLFIDLQERITGQDPKYRGFIHAFRIIWKEEGALALWKVYFKKKSSFFYLFICCCFVYLTLIPPPPLIFCFVSLKIWLNLGSHPSFGSFGSWSSNHMDGSHASYDIVWAKIERIGYCKQIMSFSLGPLFCFRQNICISFWQVFINPKIKEIIRTYESY